MCDSYRAGCSRRLEDLMKLAPTVPNLDPTLLRSGKAEGAASLPGIP